MRWSALPGFASLWVALSLPAAELPEWTGDLTPVAQAESPDHRYGMLVRRVDEDADYLVNLPEHRLLGRIAGLEYFEGKNHSGLEVRWAENSAWCAIQQTSRGEMYGLATASMEGDRFASADLGKRVLTELRKVLFNGEAKEDHDPWAHFRIDKGRVLVRAVWTSDRASAFFQGAYDVRASRWTAAVARRIARAQYASLAGAYEETEIGEPSTAEQKIAWYEERLNLVYQALRTLLPARTFSVLQQEQVAWLAGQKGLSGEEKVERWRKRAGVLEKRLW